jgi:hypothetical protein
LPLILAWLVSQFFPVYVAGRYEAVSLPYFIILISYFWAQIEGKYVSAAIALILIIFSYNSIKAERDTLLSYKFNEKIISQKLLDNLVSGDQLVFTDLSRPPFNYYLSRLNGQKKTFLEYSFPQEMEKHPAVQSTRLLMQNQGSISLEAQDLTSSLVNGKQKNIWIIYSLNNPVNEILLKKIEDGFSCQDFLDLTWPENQPVSPLHFQKILKCERI